jgi:hypothetical protein
MGQKCASNERGACNTKHKKRAGEAGYAETGMSRKLTIRDC